MNNLVNQNEINSMKFLRISLKLKYATFFSLMKRTSFQLHSFKFLS